MFPSTFHSTHHASSSLQYHLSPPSDSCPLPEGDIRALLNFGIDFAFEQCKELIGAGVPGLHFYTMDRSQSTAGVVARLRREGLL
jgi:hypothetical protein